MSKNKYDVVIAGGGTAGTFAAATTAAEGLDTLLLERKSKEDGGDIACGDALKGKSTFPDVIDRQRLEDESFTNKEIKRGVFENPKTDEKINIPFPEKGTIVDRKKYGEVLLDEAERAGAEISYDSVVTDVIQENGEIDGVIRRKNGETNEIKADVTIDAAGALSILQENADLDKATYDTNVSYKQFCSAYREIVDVEEPVEWSDAIVFKPTKELGYLWYFPRTPTRINAGLGFQMDREPMELVDVLRDDLENRDEFKNAEVRDKLGAALPTRRPYDSAVAPGFMSVGDAAGHVNPTTGGGIPGAAKSGHWAGQAAIKAVTQDDNSEEVLWEYNKKVMDDFGGKFAAVDLFNIFGTAHDVDELTELVTALPGQKLVDAFGEGTADFSTRLKIKTLFSTFGYWGLLKDLYKVHKKAGEIKDIYSNYPDTPAEFSDWMERRDSVTEAVYEITGADPKY